ncbi:MAG: hypothetical protein E3J72_20345 [Planctomycetota bacterium]|nr:MAG: hypothetical protein E3J72_20345 [Planctomycetota bacterium]
MAKRLFLLILVLPVVFQTGCYFYTRGDFPDIPTIKQRLSGAKLPYKVTVNRGEYAELLGGMKAFASCEHRPHFEGLSEKGSEFYLSAYPLSAEQAPGAFNSIFIPYNWVFGIPNLFTFGFGLPAALKIRVRLALSVQDVQGHELKKYVSEHDEKYYGWIVFVGYAYWKQKIEPDLFLDCIDRFASDLKNGRFDDYLAELKEDRKQLTADRIKREKEEAERLRQQYGGPTKSAAVTVAKEVPKSDKPKVVRVEPEKTEPVKEDPKKPEPPKKEEPKPAPKPEEPKIEKPAPKSAEPKKPAEPAKPGAKPAEPKKPADPKKPVPPPKKDDPSEPAPPPPPGPGK